MRVLWLREHIRWMGRHSGYDPLCDAIAATGKLRSRSLELRVGTRFPPGVAPALAALKRRAQGSPFYNVHSAWAELRVLASARRSPVDLVHLTYLENQFGLLGRGRRWLDAALVGTVHQPPGWYRLLHKHPGSLGAFDALIALGRRQAEWLEELAPGRVHVVRYAVDSAFFRPAPEEPLAAAEPPRVLYGGRWLRDPATLVRVVDRLLAREPEVRFDLLVPRDARKDTEWLRVARHPQVCFHAQVSDAALLRLYQRASLLLLPMVDCVGNSVLLEALACGLPVVTNDVGAMRDYTRDDFASLHEVGDAEGMGEAVLGLLRAPDERARRGARARAFAERELSWDRCAQETLEVYDAALAARGLPR